MQIERGVVYATAILIIAIAVLAGPLGLVTPSDEAMTSPETGNATITVGEMPDTATLTAGQHGADIYILRIPEITVEVSHLHGNPILDYSIGIDELGMRQSTAYFLDGHGEGPLTLGFDARQIQQERVDRDSYDGQLRLVLRGDSERVVAERPITVEVER